MRLYIKDGNTYTVNDNTKIELLNLGEFVSAIKSASSHVPTPHFKTTLKYKLTSDGKEYLGESVFDSYKAITDGIEGTLDEECPYTVELQNWNLADYTDPYLDIAILRKEEKEERKDIDIAGLVSSIDNEVDSINNEIESLKGKKASELLSDDAYKLLDLPMILFPYGEIQFFGKDEIDEMQKGFRNDPETGEVYPEWVGIEYVLVGFDATAGVGPDQYIVNTVAKDYPVYWLMTDGGDWKHPILICKSLEKFNKIMELIKSYEEKIYNNKFTIKDKNDLLRFITMTLVGEPVNDYWKDLLNNAVVKDPRFDEVYNYTKEGYGELSSNWLENKIDELIQQPELFEEFYKIKNDNPNIEKNSDINLYNINIDNPVSVYGITINTFIDMLKEGSPLPNNLFDIYKELCHIKVMYKDKDPDSAKVSASIWLKNYGIKR